MNFKGIKHTLSRDNNLFRLLLDRQASNEGSNFFRSFPFCELSKSFLPSPYTCVNDLEEEMSTLWIKDKNGAVDRLGGEIALECLVDCNTVHIGVVYEPNNLITEEF